MPVATTEVDPMACGNNEAGGRSYRVEVPSRVDGAAIVFQVLEPAQIDCRNGSPLILQGHGFSGSRTTEASGEVGMLTEAGYTVISIDQRGHGESGGTVRVMDPDFEGEDLVQIVDWAEGNLDYLAYRGNDLMLGGVGSSYGGGFQYLLYHVDPDERMDAMVPDITWHNLLYSLNPGDVTKNHWLLFFSGTGDTNTDFGMDPFIRSSLVDGLLQGRFPEAALDFFYYHGPGYFMDNSRGVSVFDSGNSQEYLLDPLTGRVPVTSDGRYIIKTPMADPYPVDVLMFQSTRDTLFPFNDAFDNYRVYSAAGGDVRLLTHSSGHELLSPNFGKVQETLASLDFYGGALADGSIDSLSNCGSISKPAATLAWFDEKLRGQGKADDVITTGDQICYTLRPGDAVSAPRVTVGGQSFPVTGLSGDEGAVTALAGPNPLPTIVELVELPEDGVIAGIPTADLSLSLGDEALDSQCMDEGTPLVHLGSCDAILFAGVGVIRAGNPVPELIDEQVFPLRGLGRHEVDLTGIAERLETGDRLVLMLYGQHPTFVGAHSRDLTSYQLQVSGSVRLPLLTPDGQKPL
ncbi:MAG: CocE/NonD family hydrolase [Oleiphilaceae bacterium]|nr:CocE/NonD family hydrolase [Oleiphilaceae bacterium]